MKRAIVFVVALVACDRGERMGLDNTTFGSGSAVAPKPVAATPTERPAEPPAETSTLRRGDKVSAEWPRNKKWYAGTLTAVYSDGTADVRWDDDGSRTKGLAFDKIKLVKRPLYEVEQTAARPSKKRGLVEGASCAGPGWQYVCGGRCTDTKTDSANCGSCGHRCDSGYSCDGSGTCRDANGNL